MSTTTTTTDTSSTTILTMKNQTDTPSTNSLLQPSTITCQICKKSPSLYRCPRCFIRTCSLQCCTYHKTSQKCNGQRDKLAYVPLYKYNEQHLKSDYYFLEHVLNCTEGSKRLGVNVLGEQNGAAAGVRGRGREGMDDDDGETKGKKPLLLEVHSQQLSEEGTTTQLSTTTASSSLTEIIPTAKRKYSKNNNNETITTTTPSKKQKTCSLLLPIQNNLPLKLRTLQNAALSRTTTLLFMPPGMSRHLSNTTIFQTKTSLIKWRMEWIFYVSSGTTKKQQKLYSTRVREDVTLKEAVTFIVEKECSHVGNLKGLLRPFWRALQELSKQQDLVSSSVKQVVEVEESSNTNNNGMQLNTPPPPPQEENNAAKETTMTIISVDNNNNNKPERTDEKQQNEKETIYNDNRRHHQPKTKNTSNELQFYIQKLPSAASNPRYISIKSTTSSTTTSRNNTKKNITSTIQDILKDMTIIEYPTIHVVFEQDVKKGVYTFPLLVQEL